MAIKYTKAYNAKIKSIVGAYNKRVKRLQKKYGSRRVAKPISIKGLKEAYTSKTDLDRKLKLMAGYKAGTMNAKIRATKEDVRTNKYEWESFQLSSKVADKKIEKLLKSSREMDKKEGRFLPSHRTISLKTQLKNLHRGMNGSYNSYIKARTIASRYAEHRSETDNIFYENFFDMLWANQEYADIDPDQVQKAHDMFEELSPEQLLELYNNEPDVSRMVEDYHLYKATSGEAMTDTEAVRARIRFENLMDELPLLIKKYKKM